MCRMCQPGNCSQIGWFSTFHTGLLSYRRMVDQSSDVIIAVLAVKVTCDGKHRYHEVTTTSVALRATEMEAVYLVL